MPVICSVIMVLNSFDVRFGKREHFLERGDAILVDYSLRNVFSACPDNVIIADFDEKTVNDYFKINTLAHHSVRRGYPAYLMVSAFDFSLLSQLIICLNHSGANTTLIKSTISFACLAVLSSDKMLQTFLFGCLNGVGGKVKAIIHTDIAACWRLRDISSRLYLSESLLKKKLKDEGVSFSKIILEERMVVAENLLNTHRYSICEVAGICGYENVSYFISVFRKYFGVTPNQYSSKDIPEKSLAY